MVAQISLLLVGQTFEAVVAFSRGPDAVLAKVVEDAKCREGEGDDLGPQVDRVAYRVAGAIAYEVRPTVVWDVYQHCVSERRRVGYRGVREGKGEEKKQKKNQKQKKRAQNLRC